MGVTALKREDLPHYTYDDYVQWEGKWELIHGIPYAMVPMPKIKHQRVSGKSFQKKEPFRDGKMVFEFGTCEIELDFGKVF